MTDQCSRIQGLLDRYLDGELDEKTNAEVVAHLAQCPDCRHQLDQLQAVDRILRDKDEPPKLAGEYWDWHRRQVWKRIRARGRGRWEKTRVQRVQWMRLGTVAAGVAAVLIAVVGGWRLISGPALRQRPRLGSEKIAVQPVPGAAGAPKGGAVGRRGLEAHTTTDGQPVRSGSEFETVSGFDAVEAEAKVGKKAAGSAAYGAARDGIEHDAGLKAERDVGGIVVADRVECETPAEELHVRPIEPVAPHTGRPLVAAAFAETTDVESTNESVVRADTVQPSILGAGLNSGALTSELMEAELCEEPPELLSIGDLPLVAPEETATVFVRALIEMDGTVSATEIERSSGIDLLDSVAVSNVRQARFHPGQMRGRAVRCWHRVVQQFRPIDTALPEAEPVDDTDE